MGVTIRQKGGKWFVFIHVHGRRKAKSVGSRKAALEVQRKLEARLALGDFGIFNPTPSPLTFGVYANRWLDEVVPATCKPSSARVLGGIVRVHLLPAFGTIPLDQLTRPAIKAFLLDKAQRYSRKYTHTYLRVLHIILARAVDDELLDHNPASRLGRTLPDTARPARDINPFTSAELARYLATMQDTYPQHYAFFLCLARTGMRASEALALTWDDVQFGQDASDPHRFLHVRRTYDREHQVFNTPKSGKSRRVDMAIDLREALLDLRAHRFDTSVLKGATTVPEVVFCGVEGKPLAITGLTRVHQQACRKAGLRVIRLHDLRHSYASIQLYEHHTPIQYVSEQLGHASITMTVNTYGHPPQGANIAFADQLTPARKRQATTGTQP